MSHVTLGDPGSGRGRPWVLRQCMCAESGRQGLTCLAWSAGRDVCVCGGLGAPGFASALRGPPETRQGCLDSLCPLTSCSALHTPQHRGSECGETRAQVLLMKESTQQMLPPCALQPMADTH